MTITLADGEGLGGGLASFDASDDIGLLSVDHGIDGFFDILWRTRDDRCKADLCEENRDVDDLPGSAIVM